MGNKISASAAAINDFQKVLRDRDDLIAFSSNSSLSSSTTHWRIEVST
jgi:hypothetical protein